MGGNLPATSVARWLRAELLLPELRAQTAAGVLEEIAQGVARAVGGLSPNTVLEAFREREALGTTAIGDGVAIPHGRVEGLTSLVFAVARHPQGVDFDAPDGRPVSLFFALVASRSAAALHLEALSTIARFLRDPARRARVMQARGNLELLATLRGEEVRGDAFGEPSHA